uniref:Uncharacterized protein n=1 Tax=Rhizophora mucronata TaxID=61149 RepID=A0A2P2PV44_RHIMU
MEKLHNCSIWFFPESSKLANILSTRDFDGNCEPFNIP